VGPAHHQGGAVLLGARANGFAQILDRFNDFFTRLLQLQAQWM